MTNCFLFAVGASFNYLPQLWTKGNDGLQVVSSFWPKKKAENKNTVVYPIPAPANDTANVIQRRMYQEGR
jgi:hypothetical protein